MLDYLIQDNNLMPILAALGGLNAQVSFHDFVLVSKFTLSKTEMMYPKNVRAKVPLDFT